MCSLRRLVLVNDLVCSVLDQVGQQQCELLSLIVQVHLVSEIRSVDLLTRLIRNFVRLVECLECEVAELLLVKLLDDHEALSQAECTPVLQRPFVEQNCLQSWGYTCEPPAWRLEGIERVAAPDEPEQDSFHRKSGNQ